MLCMNDADAHTTRIDYFTIDGAPGGNQDWFTDFEMNIGGCAAVTACDLCICLARDFGLTSLYPFDASNVSRDDYLSFAAVMKPYLRPRWRGIDTLDIYIGGFGAYVADHGGGVRLSGMSAHLSIADAEAAVVRQIDAGLPVPFLMLNHIDDDMEDFEWHWFDLAGYERGERTYVDIVTYGEWHRLPFDRIWNTGFDDEKGGLILVTL